MCGAIAAAGSNRQWLAQARIAHAHDRDRGLGRWSAMTSWWAAGLSRSCSLCPGLAGSSCEGPSTESSGLSQSPDDLAHAIGQKGALLRAWAVVNVVGGQGPLGGLATVWRALRPGGWLTLPAISVPGNDFRATFSRLRNTLWGGGASSRAGGRCGNPVRVHRRTNPPSRGHHAYGAGATTSLTGRLRSDRASASASHIPSTIRTTFSPPSVSVLTEPWPPARDPPIALPTCGNRLRFLRPPSASRGADGPS